MFLVIILIVILVLISLYFLFAPFFLEINTIEGIYRLRFHKLAECTLNFTPSSVYLDIKILFWKKQLDLLSKKEKSVKLKETKTKEKIRNKRTGSIGFNKLKAIVKSFKINKCDISIDSGNMQLNGMLYPFVYLIGRILKQNIMINFINENHVNIKIENNLARIAYAYIKS